MIIVSGIRIPLGKNLEDAKWEGAKKLSLSSSQIEQAVIHRVSYDARHGSVFLVCSVCFLLKSEKLELSLAEKFDFVRLKQQPEQTKILGETPLETRPVIIGFGPCGMFSALELARFGFCPIVIEQGQNVSERTKTVEEFFKTGTLNPQSNIQFGEGGAGTFSDGKLTTRINDPLSETVLKTFVEFGAPKEIMFQAKPHIGTDILKTVVENIRNEIIKLGGDVRFNQKLVDIDVKNNRIRGIKTSADEIATDILILAVGNGAREVFELLAKKDLVISAKPFSVGMRIEHHRNSVEQSVFGKNAGNPLLPSAEYALSCHIGNRAVYSFCMCPGGEVIAAASEQGGILTNGMSYHARGAVNSNSAICVSVSPKDFGDNPFNAINYQRTIETKAFEMAGGGFKGVATDVKSLNEGKAAFNITSVKPSYPFELVAFDVSKLFGGEISSALKDGINAFSKKLGCFKDSDAILTGPETRTSSPVKINRDENFNAVGFQGIYPCGEGAGYAGGIMSSAVDGTKVATRIIERYKPYKK